jgi:hypothetical protein
MAGLRKEIWIAQVMEQYYQVPSFLNVEGIQDMSENVDNDTINLAEAGIDPTVLINNTTYPVAIQDRDDTALTLSLDTFDTVNTVVRNAEQKELAYNKMESVIRGHRNALVNSTSLKASHAYTPSSNGTFTPVLATTGADNGSSFKLITEDDVFRLGEKFDDVDAPEGMRYLVLHSRHWNELVRTSTTLKEQRYRQTLGDIRRDFMELGSFRILKYRSAAVFNKSTGVKKAWGAAAAPSTDTISSFAFVAPEVMKAVGTTDMFDRLRDPEARGDVIGFQQRFVALPIRNKHIGAIYSAAV